ncbi:MAG: cytochrome c3 family protein [Thermodesulfobacteriota bacterium]|nr:cytochrome c3 family protein [Thermodesulfobacteriota bacterium]
MDTKIHIKNLKNLKESGMNICITCHTPEKLGLSHPVGINQKHINQVPEELPVSKGGLLLCISCHYPHGGNEKYLVREKVLKGLCNTCHPQ